MQGYGACRGDKPKKGAILDNLVSKKNADVCCGSRYVFYVFRHCGGDADRAQCTILAEFRRFSCAADAAAAAGGGFHGGGTVVSMAAALGVSSWRRCVRGGAYRGGAASRRRLSWRRLSWRRYAGLRCVGGRGAWGRGYGWPAGGDRGRRRCWLPDRRGPPPPMPRHGRRRLACAGITGTLHGSSGFWDTCP